MNSTPENNSIHLISTSASSSASSSHNVDPGSPLSSALSDHYSSISDIKEGGSSSVTNQEVAKQVVGIGTIVKAIEIFEANPDEGELGLSIDDIIEIDESPASDHEFWWHGINRCWGVNNGKSGWFPTSCVQVQIGESSYENETETSIREGRIEETNTGLSDDGWDEEEGDRTSEQIGSQGRRLSFTQDEMDENNVPTTVPVGTKVIVKHDYSPMKMDELCLRKGETIVVIEAPEGGWWKGMSNLGKDPKLGWLPSTFVMVDISQPSYIHHSNNSARHEKSKDQQTTTSTVEGGSAPKRRRSWYKRLVSKSSDKNKLRRPSTAPSESAEVKSKSVTQIRQENASNNNNNNMDGNSTSSGAMPLTAVPEDLGSRLDMLQTKAGGVQEHGSLKTPNIQTILQEFEFGPEHRRSTTAPPILSNTPLVPAISTMKTLEMPWKSIIPNLMQLEPSLTVEQWHDTIPPEKLESMTKTEKLRQTAIWELIKTERSYIRDLGIIIEIFMKPLIEDKKLNMAKNVDVLFSNIEQILKVNQVSY